MFSIPTYFEKPFADSLNGQYNDPTPPVIVNEKEEWKVNDILDAKRKKEKMRIDEKI